MTRPPRGKQPDVAVVGEILWDLHAADQIENSSTFTRVLGGGASNVATALRAADIDVAVLGVVGEGTLGMTARATLLDRGVDVTGLVARPGQTGLVFIGSFAAGTQRFFSYRPTVSLPSRIRLPESWRRGSLAGKVVHVAAVNPDELVAMSALLERVKERGATVVVDLNARPRAWRDVRLTGATKRAYKRVLGRADWVKAGDGDLRILGLVDGPVGETRGLLGLDPSAHLVVTRGGGRVSLSTPHGDTGSRPKRATVSWCVGAGDAFCAGIIRQLVEGVVPTSIASAKRMVAQACDAAREHLQRAAPK